MQKLIENIRTKFYRINSCFLRKLNLKIFEPVCLVRSILLRVSLFLIIEISGFRYNLRW